MYRSLVFPFFGTQLEISIGLMNCENMAECGECFRHVMRNADGRFRFGEIYLGPYVIAVYRMSAAEFMADTAFAKTANGNDYVEPVHGFTLEKFPRRDFFTRGSGNPCDFRGRLRCVALGLRDAIRRSVSGWRRQRTESDGEVP